MTKSAVVVLILVLAAANVFAQSRTLTCIDGKAGPAERLNDLDTPEKFATNYLGTELKDMPAFSAEWLTKVVDQNGDGKIDGTELDRIVCDIVGVYKREFPDQKPGPLLDKNGNTDWMAYQAGLREISGSHLKYYLATYARAWVTAQLQVGLDAASAQTLKTFLKSGKWSVAQKDLEEQFDLLGADQSAPVMLEKYLSLAYRVIEYQKQMGSLWPVLKSQLLAETEKQKSFPYVTYPGKDQVIVAFNTVTINAIGVPGADRYYVQLGQALTISTSKKPSWGQASDQQWFIVTKPEAFPETDKFVGGLRRKLQRLCKTLKPSDTEFVTKFPAMIDDVNAKIQNFSDKLSDLFLEDPVKIELVNDRLERHDRAHHDVEQGLIQFSYPNMDDVIDHAVGENINRYLVFISMHEYIHYLQSKTDIYEMNNRLYNQGQAIAMLFGQTGYRSLYSAQPLERDAQGLAGEFVQMLDNKCAL